MAFMGTTSDLHRIGEIFRICPTGIVEEQAEKRPILLADMEEIWGYIKDTSPGTPVSRESLLDAI